MGVWLPGDGASIRGCGFVAVQSGPEASHRLQPARRDVWLDAFAMHVAARAKAHGSLRVSARVLGTRRLGRVAHRCRANSDHC